MSQGQKIDIVVSENFFKTFIKDIRSYLIPFAIILVCLVAFYLVVLPNISSIFALRDQEASLNSQVAQLQANQTSLSSINDKAYASYLAILTRALPQIKDYTGVIKELGAAANVSGVTLSDYSFQVGNLATLSANLSSQNSLSVNFQANADINDAQVFIEDLLKSVPLCEISSVNISDGVANINASFFYQPFTTPPFNATIPIYSPSGNDISLINSIKDWETIQDQNAATASSELIVAPSPTSNATSSATDSTSYSSAFDQSYLSSCNAASSNQAPDYCQCTLNYFHNNYTPDQVTQMDQQVQQDPSNPPQGITNAINACTVGTPAVTVSPSP